MSAQIFFHFGASARSLGPSRRGHPKQAPSWFIAIASFCTRMPRAGTCLQSGRVPFHIDVCSIDSEMCVQPVAVWPECRLLRRDAAAERESGDDRSPWPRQQLPQRAIGSRLADIGRRRNEVPRVCHARPSRAEGRREARVSTDSRTTRDGIGWLRVLMDGRELQDVTTISRQGPSGSVSDITGGSWHLGRSHGLP